MTDSITTEEETHTFGYYLSSASNAIDNIFKQQSSFTAVTQTDYESIGSYEDYTPQTISTSMTLTTNLESGEYESLEEWSAPVIKNDNVGPIAATATTLKLTPVSAILDSKEPAIVTQLRCRHHEKKKEKQREVPLLPQQITTKSLKDLTPINSSTTERVLPAMIPLQMKASINPFASSSIITAPTESIRRHEMKPLKTLLPQLKLLNKDRNETISTAFDALVLPNLIPLQKKGDIGDTMQISSSFVTTPFKMPTLLPLETKRSLNSVKDMWGTSFFSATATSPLGASLGAFNKFDLGCGFRGDPIRCPHTYLEKNRPDLYKLWRTYNTIPASLLDKGATIILVPSENALSTAISSYMGDEVSIRAYLQSHIVKTSVSELASQEPDTTVRYPTELSSFDVQLTTDRDRNLSVSLGNQASGNRIILEKTTHKQILLMSFDDDYYPPHAREGDDGAEEIMTMDGIIGNVKKRFLHTTGLKKKHLLRKYEDLVYSDNAHHDDDSTIWAVTGDITGESRIRVKIETYRKINRGAFTFNDNNPTVLLNSDTNVARSGKLAVDHKWTYMIRLAEAHIKLSDVFNNGLSVSLRDLAPQSSKSKRNGDDGFKLPSVFKKEPLYLAFDLSDLPKLKDEVTEERNLIAFKAVKKRGLVDGIHYFVFKKKGTCLAGTSFNPSKTSCGYELSHIMMVFMEKHLFPLVDYKTSFIESSFSSNVAIKTESLVTGNPFEDCLYGEMIQRGNNFGQALASVEKKNQFGDFVSMNGSLKLITALSKEIKDGIAGIDKNNLQKQASMSTTKVYDTVNLHTVLFDMNATYLPLKKQEVSNKAQQIIGSLIQRMEYNSPHINKQTRLNILTNLDHTVDTLAHSINNIRVNLGEV